MAWCRCDRDIWPSPASTFPQVEDFVGHRLDEICGGFQERRGRLPNVDLTQLNVDGTGVRFQEILGPALGESFYNELHSKSPFGWVCTPSKMI